VAGGSSHTVARRSDGQVVVGGSSLSFGVDRVPALRPGESYVQVSARFTQTVARVGPTSTYVTFAAGCSGSMPAARLVPRDTPRIGEVESVEVSNLPNNAAIMVFGWSRNSAVSLSSVGMPGCSRHISMDASVLLVGANGRATFELPLPNWSGLVGLSFYNQALVLDPGANPLGAVVSDAAEAIVGEL
jgi:hypothetical protein